MSRMKKEPSDQSLEVMGKKGSPLSRPHRRGASCGTWSFLNVLQYMLS